MTAELTNISPDCEIVSTRVFKASREAVFEAWTNPAILQTWWGPVGFTNTFYEFDLRPGGRWRFVMHGPEKGNYPNECVFAIVEKPSLLVWDRLSKPLFRVVVQFEEVSPEQTNLVFRMQFENAAECNKLKGFVPEKNEENFDKLERILLKQGDKGVGEQE